ncbi:PRD domain-containing protein [Streptococcus castoreus]|uniref:PRD domain-containing protein n=1 Tax=Streptococcus castoreus TaxID=254786 RepID=UPI0003F57951|nr:PRD domain-containing protein [Streptococcus castoreus]
MEVVKKINNNVAECIDGNGRSLIAFGKGIGFPKMPYILTDLTMIDMTFYKLERHFEQLLTELPEIIVTVSVMIVTMAQKELQGRLNPTLVFSLADHIHFAIQRLNNYQEMKLLFSHEVEKLYPLETRLGEQAREMLKEQLGVVLPKSEITTLAMHFVTSQTEFKQSQEELRLEDTIEQVTQIIEQSLHIQINRDEFNYNRFKNHIRYYIMHMRGGEQFMDDNSSILESLKHEKNEIYTVAYKIGQVINQSYCLKMTGDELLYLMIHINRLYDKNERRKNDAR